jgi:hypothetical protein
VFTPAAGTCATPVSISVTVGKCTTKSAAVTQDSSAGETAAISEDAVGSSAMVYPNPSTGNFTLQLKSNTHEAVEVHVLDLVGHGIYHARGDAGCVYTFGGNFIPGIYFVEILHQKKIEVLKVIKQ